VTLYHVSFDVRSQGGRPMGGGLRHADAATAADAEAAVIAEVRASYGAPRARITATAKLPAPQCPACGHWHAPRIADGAACCGCREG
jgi:hypothetical protein